MGTSHSWAEVTVKFKSLAREYADLPKSQVEEASLIVKKSVVTRAPARLRGVGKRGAKLGVRYNLTQQREAVAQSLVFATGPFQLIERDTKAHRIPRTRVRGRKRYAVIPGVGVRAYANHPGTKGKHPWQEGVDAATPLVKRLFEVKSELALRRIF